MFCLFQIEREYYRLTEMDMKDTFSQGLERYGLRLAELGKKKKEDKKLAEWRESWMASTLETKQNCKSFL